MKLQNIKRGFTLIELLVVITIIGILATGATTIYTSQIQKARDATRISSVKALQSAVEQVYQDKSEYPYSTTFATQVGVYLENLPSDPKHNQPCNDGGTPADAPECAIAYIVGDDNNGITFGEYEISTAFENSGNVSAKAVGDSGTDDVRLEIGLDTTNNITRVDSTDMTGANSGACGVDGNVAGTTTTLIIINGSPATTGNECG